MGEGGNSAEKNLFVILEELTEKIREKKKVVPNAQVPPIVYLQKSLKKKKKILPTLALVPSPALDNWPIS